MDDLGVPISGNPHMVVRWPHIHPVPQINLQLWCETSLPLLCQRDVTFQCCSLKTTTITRYFVRITVVGSIADYCYYSWFQHTRPCIMHSQQPKPKLPRCKKATSQLAQSRCVVSKPCLGRRPLGMTAANVWCFHPTCLDSIMTFHALSSSHILTNCCWHKQWLGGICDFCLAVSCLLENMPPGFCLSLFETIWNQVHHG